MFQHLHFQFVGTNYLASDITGHLIQLIREFRIFILYTSLSLTMRIQFLLVQLQVHLITLILPYKREAHRIPFRIVTIVVLVGRTKGKQVDEEERL